eukprot:10878718-Alexandrium_andersonii.AAC.1
MSKEAVGPEADALLAGEVGCWAVQQAGADQAREVHAAEAHCEGPSWANAQLVSPWPLPLCSGTQCVPERR